MTILSTLTDVKTAKKNIIENSEDMGKEEKLLRFEKQLKSASKTPESAEQVFSKNQSSGNNNNTRNGFFGPFPEAPPLNRIPKQQQHTNTTKCIRKRMVYREKR